VWGQGEKERHEEKEKTEENKTLSRRRRRRRACCTVAVIFLATARNETNEETDLNGYRVSRVTERRRRRN